MLSDIAMAREAGADGVVLGVLTPDGEVDVKRTRVLVEAAREGAGRAQAARRAEVTFHRAIDMTRDMHAALEDVIGCGVNRVLTSGGAATAMQGLQGMAALVKAARGRVDVMVCGGVRAGNVMAIVEATGAREFHAALRTASASPVMFRRPELKISGAGDEDYVRHVLRVEDVRELRGAIEGVFSKSAAAR
jgi:copper homeostasis protein